MRRRENFAFWPLLDDLSLKHDDDLVRYRLNRGYVVGDVQVGHSGLFLQTHQQFQNALLNDLIESRGHLVANDDIGLRGERSRDADALLLPARKFRGQPVVERLVQFNHVQQFNDLGLEFSSRSRVVESQRPPDDFANGLHWVHRRIGRLVDHLNSAQLICCSVFQGGGKRFSVENHAALFRRQESGDHPRGRRFSGP